MLETVFRVKKGLSMFIYLLLLAGFLALVILAQIVFRQGLYPGASGQINSQKCQLALSRLGGCYEKTGKLNPYGYVDMPLDCQGIAGFSDGTSANEGCNDPAGDEKICCNLRQPS